MQARFLLGPAGSGKTFRCLAEIRAELATAPEGPPLVLLAPKQATFQLERQLFAGGSLSGYTRLRILSFPRLAEFIFNQLGKPLPELLAEEGRVMVLRALLARRSADLTLFHASARLPGFAQKVSALLREFQQCHLSPTRLDTLNQQVGCDTPLGRKLHDLALLLCAYLDWLNAHHIQDADSLLTLAADELRSATRDPRTTIHLAGLWLDGFAQMTPQEQRLLAALVPCCERATLAFCLEGEPPEHVSWHSPWALIGQTYQRCFTEISKVADTRIEILDRHPDRSRFGPQAALQHLERSWTEPKPFPQGEAGEAPGPSAPIRVVACPNPEAEATLAARETLHFVREEGGRFRDVAVLVRQLESYHEPLRRVFARYEIPFFLDRREPIAHHPQAELTRFALRTLAYGWKPPDWFAALKTGLVPAADPEVDELENEALARGWEGSAWKQPVRITEGDALAERLERLRQRLVTPFAQLEKSLAGGRSDAPPVASGAQLADALFSFWRDLGVERRLERWSFVETPKSQSRSPNSIHLTVWTQMNGWLENLALAFRAEAMPLNAWLPIVEAGLAQLTVGVIPPALDQVLIGAIDRSRNPDLRRVFVLGLNETVFPAPPPQAGLLTEVERGQLEQRGQTLGPNHRLQLGHERFYGYIACTRARERLTLTYAQRDADGAALNPSILLAHLLQLFPDLKTETFSGTAAIEQAEHRSELHVPLLRLQSAGALSGQDPLPAIGLPQWARLAALPVFSPLLSQAAGIVADRAARLSPETAEMAYGTELRTSVSALEDFAACPFKFFVRRGLRAEERKEFEIDPREKGSFQHEVLRDFHQSLQTRARQWRDLLPEEAQELIRQLGEEQRVHFRNGLFAASDERKFTGRLLIEGLEKLIGILVRWNREQYRFDPHAVEVDFGLEAGLPGWRLDLDGRHTLLLRGRIDRVDLCPIAGRDEALAAVIDYKSSERKLDPLKLQHGLELQLLAYLGVLRHLADPQGVFNVSKLLPAGVFYVNLRGSARSGKTRTEVFENEAENRGTAYQHLGRFDRQFLKQFDSRGVSSGDQFKYAINQDGSFSKRGNEALDGPRFVELIDQVEAHVRRIGLEIYGGRVQPEPYRQGSETACDHCDYRAICRFDAWVQPYRTLRPSPKPIDAAPVKGRSRGPRKPSATA